MVNLLAQPGNEQERIAALEQLHILDTVHEEDFDDIVFLAAQLCETPVSAIAFFDGNRSWFKAKYGIEMAGIPGDIALSTDGLQEDGSIVINDTNNDVLFSNNPLGKEGGGVRFFAAVPLINEDGFALGYLCVMDYQPRTLAGRQHCGLMALGRQVTALLRLRLRTAKLNKAEAEARSDEEQLRSVFDNAIDAVIVVDDQGTILQWNPKAESIFGWTAEEVTGKYVYDTIIPERHRELYFARIKQYELTGDEPAFHETIEIRAMRKYNLEFYIALGISPAIIKGKRFFVCFISDITERKSITDKLEIQKKFYENILNNLPIDIAVFDPSHRYLFVNPGAIRNEEFRKYIIGKDDFEYCEYRNRDISYARIRRERFLTLKATGKEIRWEDTIVNSRGEPVTSLRRFFPVYDENGDLSIVIGFGLDITDRKLLEEKQTALVKQLSMQNTQLIDFCNIVSHNLRGPLVNLSMLAEFIDECEDPEEQKQLIGKLDDVIDKLHSTFNELVESIQVKQNLEIRSEKIILKDCFENAITALDAEINRVEVTIEATFDDAPVLNFPPKYMSGIFYNLVSNTLKYHSPQRKPIVKVESKNVNGKVIISVNDNGLGINLVKHKDKIFKIGKVFHRHPNSKGFGLFMTRTQVEAMGGRIWVESIPDEGSTFFIEFNNHVL